MFIKEQAIETAGNTSARTKNTQLRNNVREPLRAMAKVFNFRQLEKPAGNEKAAATASRYAIAAGEAATSGTARIGITVIADQNRQNTTAGCDQAVVRQYVASPIRPVAKANSIDIKYWRSQCPPPPTLRMPRTSRLAIRQGHACIEQGNVVNAACVGS